MTERETPRCPWCGSEMERGDYVSERNYICTICSAESPPISPDCYMTDEQEWEAAYAAAMKRVESENRVLTLEEAIAIRDEPAFIELSDETDGFWIIRHEWADSCEPFKAAYFNMKWYLFTNYGITWRCWLRKPTDEERAKAAWEGEAE